MHDSLAALHIGLRLARVNAGVEDFLRRAHALQAIGGDAVFPTVRDAVIASPGPYGAVDSRRPGAGSRVQANVGRPAASSP